MRLVSEMMRESVDPVFRVVHAGRLEDGINKLKNNGFDVILLDLDLPDSRGLETLFGLLKNASAIPVIVLTGIEDERLGIEAIQNKASDYMVKGSIDKRFLVRAIRYAIERKREELEREHLLEEVKLSGQRLTWALVAGRGGAWDLDMESGKAWWSPEMYPLWGVASDTDLVLENLLALVDERDREGLRNAITESVEKHLSLRFEFRIHHPLRGERWMEKSGDVVYDSAGRAIRMIGIAVDITERKKSEEVLKRDKEELERMVRDKTRSLLSAYQEVENTRRLSDIGTLAATVAHELRNPLAAINMAAANIKRKAQNPALDGHLRNIEKKISESDQIINNLLYYTRIRAPNYEDVNINAVIEECIVSSKKQCEAAKMVSLVNKMVLTKDILIEADPLQMKEVFSNILNNSCDAVPQSNGEIEIFTDNKEESVTVSIRDNGAGIDKVHLEKVFQPFFTTKAKGTGLGLSVCREIVNLHGGTITIDSELGRGTNITVSLPKKRTHTISPEAI